VKHDCSRVMEFRREGNSYRNGFDQLIELEHEYLYPMLKSSELANLSTNGPIRAMLVTQKTVGEETASIRDRAPKTWEYLLSHAALLDKRASTIYRNRPRFSVFGVGSYTFSPWKVAISGFYKHLRFVIVGPCEDKPTVLDDTSYLIPCRDQPEAEHVASLLNSEIAHEFYSAFVFWDAKRPITTEILRRLDLAALARELDASETKT